MDCHDASLQEKDSDIEEIFEGSFTTTSSQEVSIESVSITPEDSPKMKLYKQGLYDPGTGDICTEYVVVSSSSVREHVYFCYPGVTDPGIREALLRPEKSKIYADDGQDLYVDLCKEMKIMPVRLFHRGLRDKIIDLRYYGINPKGVRAMCMALVYNRTVKRLDLTGNFLEGDDACYHIGQMLGEKNALQSLVLAGCNIGSKGVLRLVDFLPFREMFLLDLSRNNIKDKGLSYLTEVMDKGAVIKHLNLSHNDLSSQSALLLADALAFNDTVTHLDLSWNKFMKPRGPTALCRRLGHSKTLVKLDLSWTGLNLTLELRNLLGIKNLRILILSHNRLSHLAARTIARSLHLGKKLQYLDLSSNPFMPADALMILEKMRNNKIKIQELRMDHIVVSKEFADELQEIKALDFRKNTKITHGTVLRNYTIPLHDMRTITVKRLAITMRKKRSKLNVIDYLLEQNKTHDNLEPGAWIRTLKLYDIHVDEDIIDGILSLFPGPKNENGWKTINLTALVEYIHRLWPERRAPPTPPPATPPEPEPPVDLKKHSQKDLKKSSKKDLKKHSQKDLNKESKKDLNKDSKKDLNKDSKKDLNKDSKNDLNKDSKKDLNKDSKKDINKESKKDLNKDSKKDLNKDFKKDLNKESKKDFNKDSKKDLNKDSKKDFKKDLNRDSKKDFNKDSKKDLKKGKNIPQKGK